MYFTTFLDFWPVASRYCILLHTDDRRAVVPRDPWFPDGTVCQADASLTSFCVEGRCEPFLCPSPLGAVESSEGGYYPFLLHEARCQAAPPSFLPSRPSTDKENCPQKATTTVCLGFCLHPYSMGLFSLLCVLFLFNIIPKAGWDATK